ncbi:glutaredoxin [Terfezia boudieri ATCC MYA-4762]|uniref:Glutaredoxin n=1 Tax=Terfezia boudieri ATCC MYA-4762 TaxID=1051890 RepID=A0A3N4LD32_9PEZI|nr:glutaredoxin [Terfezia boudieri ATCC MYA-4762]
MAKVLAPKTGDDFDNIIKAVPERGFVAISFHTSWAASPCEQINQTFAAIAATQPSTSTFISIDAEDLPDISEKYEVAAVPFFVFLRGGQVVGKISGADPKQLQSKIEDFSAPAGAADGTAIPPAQITAAPPTPDVDVNGSGGEPEESLTERLQKLLTAAPVMLFMKGTPSAPQCGFSRQMVALLRERQVRYGFFNILADDEVRQGLKDYSNWPTYPQLYVGGELVGGLDIVKEEFENDKGFLSDYRV